jgi:hypothetical protein
MLPDPNLFVFEFPVWFIAVSKTGTARAVSVTDPDIGVLCAKSNTGERCVSIFTDQDLATRFAEALNISHPILTELKSARELLQFLGEAKVFGHSKLIIDPQRESKAMQVHSITEVMNAIQRA